MAIDQGFVRERYAKLQSGWRQLAKDHGHHYLKYLAPRAPVDFVLVAKMTSIREKDAAETRPGEYPDIPAPGYNLLASIGDLILNHAAYRHLCWPGERYYVTDLGKCAVPAKYVKGHVQQGEFEAWYPMLLEELELVAKPEATVIPVGSATADFLNARCDFPYRVTMPVLHWSGAAVSAAKMASSLFPREWDEYRRKTSWEDVRGSIEEIFIEAGLGKYVDSVDCRLKDTFKEFHAHYMFTYKKEMPLRRPGAS